MILGFKWHSSAFTQWGREEVKVYWLEVKARSQTLMFYRKNTITDNINNSSPQNTAILASVTKSNWSIYLFFLALLDRTVERQEKWVNIRTHQDLSIRIQAECPRSEFAADSKVWKSELGHWKTSMTSRRLSYHTAASVRLGTCYRRNMTAIWFWCEFLMGSSLSKLRVISSRDVELKKKSASYLTVICPKSLNDMILIQEKCSY